MEQEMEGNYLTPDVRHLAYVYACVTVVKWQERTMMEDKQRKLRRDVAASSIGSAIRGFLARKRYEHMRKQLSEQSLEAFGSLDNF